MPRIPFAHSSQASHLFTDRPEVIVADWQCPDAVKAFTTTRIGGASEGICASLNMGYGINDERSNVHENRRRVTEHWHLPSEPIWLRQVHGTRCVSAVEGQRGEQADASVAHSVGTVCAIMTADCLPVLLAAHDASVVAAAHAGWRGLCGGILEQTVAATGTPGSELIAWLGPAISGAVYEVDAPVRDAFLRESPQDEDGFQANRPGHWLADLYWLARARLTRAGISTISGGERCTYSESDYFYSYRRDGSSGRMASFIWLES